MIVQSQRGLASSLGNTLNDIGDDINQGNLIQIPSDIINGLTQNDGWAILITLTSLYIGFRLLQGIYHVPTKTKKAIQGKVRKTRKKIARKIEGS